MLDLDPFLQSLTAFNPFVISAVFYLLAILVMLGFLKLYGSAGLYVYSAIAVISGNIQVLKVVSFPLLPNPVSLGDIMFVSLFLCSSMLTEFYGKAAAIRGIYIGFLAYFAFTLFMFLTLLYVPATESAAFSVAMHTHMKALFLPGPSLFLASLLAYFASQYLGILLFAKLRQKNHTKHLWLRTEASSLLGIFLDNVLFSVLAWYVFIPTGYSLHMIFNTYVVGAMLFRVLWGPLNIPAMYLARKMHKP